MIRPVTLGDEIARIVGPALPAELVSPAALDALATTLRIFPVDTSRIYGFECRLLGDDPQVDFFMRVVPSPDRVQLLAGPATDAAIDGAGWAPLVELVERLDGASSPVWRDVRQIWFEFDVPVGGPVRHRPGLLFLHPRFTAPERRDWADRQLAVADVAVRHTTGAPMPPQVAHRLRSVLGQLPPAADVFCTGVAVARPGAGIRLCLKGLAHGQHLGFLHRIGCRDTANLALFLDTVGRHADVINLDLDLQDTVGPKLHLELRCDEEVRPGAMRRWPRLVQHLVDLDLLDRAKGAAFLGWPGLPVDDVDLAAGGGLFLRKLSHVKVAWEHDQPVGTKGYFGVWECLRWA